jgi:hypothetical protein
MVLSRAVAAPLRASAFGGSSEAQQEIDAALDKWTMAFNDRDAHVVCDLFAPDLIADYQGQPQRSYASL